MKAMVMAFNEMMKGQDRIDCIMTLYTLVAHWIFHMRPEALPEDLAIDMVVRGIYGTLEQIRKEGIEPGEKAITSIVELKFTN